jgi:hypothetical protein
MTDREFEVQNAKAINEYDWNKLTEIADRRYQEWAKKHDEKMARLYGLNLQN